MKILLDQFLNSSPLKPMGIIPMVTPTSSTAHSQTTPSVSSEIKEIKSSIQALSRAMASLHKKANPPSKKPTAPNVSAKGTTPNPTQTYSAVAGSRPPNPSIMVDLAHMGIAPQDWPKLDKVCDIITKALNNSPFQQVQIAAARWTAKGNLIVTGGHTVTAQILHTTSHLISEAIAKAFKMPTDSPPPPTRANVKWFKLLINGVPTGVSRTQGPYSPEECHMALASVNLSYAHLLVTRKPSWVCPPYSYKAGSC
jgi:hypothetical protein